jgi:hypothetical protein
VAFSVAKTPHSNSQAADIDRIFSEIISELPAAAGV